MTGRECAPLAPIASPVVRYTWVLSALLLAQGVGGAALKITAGRTEDLAHSGIHLLSGLVGLVVAFAPRHQSSRRFLLAFGLAYLALAVGGALSLTALGLLHLGPADHVFHALVAAITLVVAVRSRRDRRTLELSGATR